MVPPAHLLLGADCCWLIFIIQKDAAAEQDVDVDVDVDVEAVLLLVAVLVCAFILDVVSILLFIFVQEIFSQ